MAQRSFRHGLLSVDVVARCVIQGPKPEPSIMRYELTDYEWTAIKPMLPNKPRGVPRANDRRVLNGIFWVLRSGAPWRDLPNALGPLHHLLQSLRSLGSSAAAGLVPVENDPEQMK
jgi:Putative transposase of IS4/5 family (DUF4096)